MVHLSIEALEDRTLLSAGTPFLVADINPGATSSNPHDLVAVDGQTYFIADDGLNNRALWRSDGTGEGTVKVTTYVNDLTWTCTPCAYRRMISATEPP